VALLAVSAGMLTVIQPPVGWWPLAWVAMVPFVLACSPSVRARTLFVTAYIVSACYWLGNLYWIFPVTWLGWAAFCFYTAFLWPLLALCVRYCRAKGWPLFVVLAVLVVGSERLQGFLLGGFFWRFLAHSQYGNTELIQIADIFGAGGVSFLVAMVNGCIAELLIRAIAAGTGSKSKAERRLGGALVQAAFVCAVVVGAILYGRWRISQTEGLVYDGPVVASVQSNVPQSVKESYEASEQMLDDLLAQSNQAARARPELTVWPETMVQAILDERVLRIVGATSRHKIFDKKLSDHAKEVGYLLVGASGGAARFLPDGRPELGEKYNSAFLYKPDGTRSPRQYNKIHLVPFGEVVPFKKTWPWLYSLLMKFTPYDFDYSLDYGTEYTIFKMVSGRVPDETTYNFAVMICYEGTVPAIARKFALDERGNKRIDWLVNISNDGWFVRFEDGRVWASAELAQHACVYVFRAIENRLAVVRSVNTGISCLVDTLGRIRDGYVDGTLPKRAMARTGMAGWFVDRLPIDKRVTFFSKHGQWLDTACAVCFGLLSLAAIPGGLRRARKT